MSRYDRLLAAAQADCKKHPGRYYKREEEVMPAHRLYLGDGVYADFDGFHVILTAEDGIKVTDTVLLDPGVFDALVKFVAKVREEA